MTIKSFAREGRQRISESLEAFRLLGEDVVQEMRIIADDMGSLEITVMKPPARNRRPKPCCN